MSIKRILSITIIFVMSLVISSCSIYKISKNPVANRFSRDDGKIADNSFQKIVEAIDKKDKEGLKKMFSAQALKETKDINDGIDYLMEFYKGKIVSNERALEVSESTNHGVDTSELKCFYTVTTDVDKYIVFFIDRIVDDKNPDNVGLYMVQIIKLSDRDKEFDWGSNTRCAGIYRPSDAKKIKLLTKGGRLSMTVFLYYIDQHENFSS
ncbi:DUF5104 domain-containing protein [Clostridium sp. C8-1-8]|uniref:DUF5104 domain-containing protein n=1 Tax=Clostridium sp. C8-1-8 TaxID=2698831 RepID=UPI00136FBE62|nr:DUF5104 domain-containing protein [Clostridium sp. C8-1-8]